MSPDDLDRLSHTELKGLLVKQWEQIVELQRMVAALRDEIARLMGGPPRPEPHAERHGTGDRAKTAGEFRRQQASAGEHAVEAFDP